MASAFDEHAPTSIECVGSGVLVDPPPTPDTERATCPACGQVTPVGGWPLRYLVHREPAESPGYRADFHGLGAS